MNLKYRTVKQNDNEQLASMIRACFIEHNAPTKGTVFEDPTTDNLSELFKKENSILWVAELDGIAEGCCGIFPTQDLPNGYCELVKFYISPKLRNKKIGLHLFKKCLQSALEMNYTHVYIESLPEYNKAIEIYEKFGFQYLNHSMGNSCHNGCNIWMILELNKTLNYIN